jgi:hypothetical protein
MKGAMYFNYSENNLTQSHEGTKNRKNLYASRLSACLKILVLLLVLVLLLEV